MLAALAKDVDLSQFWDSDELAALLGVSGADGEVPEPQLDQANELLKKWKTKRGQLWLVGSHRLLCGDSTKKDEVARLWGSVRERPALMVTDPPYGVEYDPQWRDGRVGEFGIQARCGDAVA